MGIDFWNNPIIVSAFRVKYRRAGIFNVTTVYLLVLVAGGAILARYDDPIKLGPWQRNYLLALLGVQFAVSALTAGNTTATSIRAEVINRTLDYQRIATLSPARILLGKLLGEPAQAYLLAIATFPLAAFCWTLGVAGVSLDVLLLVYLTLASTTFLFGSLGLVQRLEPGSGRTSGIGGTFAAAVILCVVVLPPLFAGARSVLSHPWSAAAVGLLTPIPAFFGIYTGDPWGTYLNFFGIQLPLPFVTPMAQLCLAFFCFHIMVRRLINPLNPSISKRLAYLSLLSVDVLTAAVLFEPTPLVVSLGLRAAVFCLVHLLAGLWLMNGVTPWRESLVSWAWRLRGRAPRLWDWWLGERSENGLVLITFCGIGLLCLVLLVLLPAGLQEGIAELRRYSHAIAIEALMTAVLLLTLGNLHQWCLFIAGRSGKALLVSFMVISMLPLHLFGEYFHNDLLLTLTPSAHIAHWFSNRLLPHPEYLLAVYAGLVLLSWRDLRRRMSRLEEAIDRKLQTMGVTKAATVPLPPSG